MERDTFCKVPGQACVLLLLWLFSLCFPHEFLGFNNPGGFQNSLPNTLQANDDNTDGHWDTEGGHG